MRTLAILLTAFFLVGCTLEERRAVGGLAVDAGMTYLEYRMMQKAYPVYRSPKVYPDK